MSSNLSRLSARQEMVAGFFEHFCSEGYQEVAAEPLIPAKDRSVYYVGATINRFKGDMEKAVAPYDGKILHQQCLRLFSINDILKNDRAPYFCYFTMLGAYRSSSHLSKVCTDMVNFLQKGLSISPSHMRAIASNDDHNIFNPASVACNLEFSNADEFDWKFGMMGIVGRGLLIEVMSEQGGWKEIGQIIQLSKDGQPFGCELAFGVETLQWALDGGSDFRDFWTVQEVANSLGINNDWRFLDSVSTACVMYNAGAKADTSKHGQMLKKVLRNISYIAQDLQIDDNEVQLLAEKFSVIELGNVDFIPQLLSDYTESNHTVRHNQDRFRAYVQDLHKKTLDGSLALAQAFDRAVRKADGACFLPAAVRDRILNEVGIKLG